MTRRPRPQPATIADRLEALAREVAVVLRAADLWQNRYSDAYQAVHRDIVRLENERREHVPLPEVRRPLSTWKDADNVLMAIIRAPRGLESGVMFEVPCYAILWLSRQFWAWQQAGVEPPVNVRVMQFGNLCVEWKHRKAYLIVDACAAMPGEKCPPLTVPTK